MTGSSSDPAGSSVHGPIGTDPVEGGRAGFAGFAGADASYASGAWGASNASAGPAGIDEAGSARLVRAHLVDEEMDDDNAVTVRILGEPFHIRGGTAEEVEAIAAYVGAKVDEVRQRNEGLPLRSLLILASLNIAEDLFRQRREHEEELRGIEDRTRAMRARLEADCLPIAIPD